MLAARLRFAGPPLFGVAFGALLRFFEAIRLALDRDDFGMMHESIDERDHAPGVRKHLGPRGEGFVGSHQGALLFVASIQELEEQIGMAIRVGQIANFVD